MNLLSLTSFVSILNVAIYALGMIALFANNVPQAH